MRRFNVELHLMNDDELDVLLLDRVFVDGSEIRFETVQYKKGDFHHLAGGAELNIEAPVSLWLTHVTEDTFDPLGINDPDDWLDGSTRSRFGLPVKHLEVQYVRYFTMPSSFPTRPKLTSV